MTEKRSSTEWFVKDEAGVRGPFAEAEMRKIVKRSSDPRLRVKQGNSVWHSVALIRKKIEELAEHGIYIRCNGIAEGPFTMTKAHELLNTVSMQGIDVRTGKGGKWVTASSWLQTLEKLRRRRHTESQPAVAAARPTPPELTLREDQKTKPVTAIPQPAVANDKPVVMEAILVEEVIDRQGR